MIRTTIPPLLGLWSLGVLLAGSLAASSKPSMSVAAFVPICGGSAGEFVYSSPALQVHLAKGDVALRSEGGEVRFSYPGSSSTGIAQGEGLLTGRVNIFKEKSSCSDLPMYREVLYPNLYPGVSLRLQVRGRILKSEYSVEPDAAPDEISMRYSGAISVRRNAGGDLVVATTSGDWVERRPQAWQMGKHAAEAVPVSWRVRADGSVGFAVGKYDRRRILVIDPALSYSTYLANATNAIHAVATGIALDSAGNSYVSGWIEGNGLGAPLVGQITDRGSIDGFLIKTSPTGAMLFATYFGGTGSDQILGVAVDGLNRVWVTGVTSSSDLPVLGALQSTLRGSRNAFVAQFSSGGTLLFSSYFGGSGPDSGNGIVADSGGSAYVVGDTQSSNLTVKQAAQSRFGGVQDAFVAKFGPTGTLVYATYLGGSDTDHGAAIAVDAGGAAYVTGATYSRDFPTHAAFQATLHGVGDAFVAKLDSTGANVVYSTYLGGSGGTVFLPEQGNAIAVDAVGDVYVAGVTSSSDFPVSSPAVQPTLLGFSDAFMLEFDPTGTVLLYSTLLGGTGEDTATGLAIDHFGAVCVVGYSSSADFPSAAPIQASFGGVYDAFVTILSPAGSGYYFSTLLGGSGIDQITGVAVDGMGDITVSGQTGSADFPLLNPVLTHFGGIDAFAMKIATNDNAMFVNRVYYGVFQSLPSAAILAQWTTELNQGVSRAQVALSLLQDPTAYAQAFSVVSEYLTILAREPDYGGFEFWARALRNGFSQADLLTTFISSPEFQLRFNASSNTAFVTLLYLNALGRPPDPDGLTFWVNYLNNGLARSLLLQIFLNSPEFQSTFGNHILVDYAYIALLSRAVDPASRLSWINQLNQGVTPWAFINAIIGSVEFNAGL